MNAKEIKEIINTWEDNQGLILSNQDKTILAESIEAKSKKEAEDVVIKIIEAVSSEYRGAIELDEQYGLGEIIETIRSTAFGKEGDLL